MRVEFPTRVRWCFHCCGLSLVLLRLRRSATLDRLKADNANVKKELADQVPKANTNKLSE